jgi:phage-related holin
MHAACTELWHAICCNIFEDINNRYYIEVATYLYAEVTYTFRLLICIICLSFAGGGQNAWFHVRKPSLSGF